MPFDLSQHVTLLLRSPRFVLAGICLCAVSFLGGCRTGAFPEYPTDYREYAYVADTGSDTVSVLDLVHIRQQAVLSVAPRPIALAVNPVRNEVYVLSQGAAPASTGSLAIVDSQSNQVVAQIRLGRTPSALAVNAAGTRLYVANTAANSISTIDLDTRRQTSVVGAGEMPDAIATSPDGSTLVVANGQSGSVTLMDLRAPGTPVLRASFAGCPGAASILVLNDSSKAFVACAGGHQVMAIALRTPAELHHPGMLPVEHDSLLAMLDVGLGPVRLIPKPDGGEIFVANQDADTISEIATGTNEVGGATLIGDHPVDGVVSADNALLWVANQTADTVAIYSVDDGKLINTVHVGAGPGPVAFSADGHLLLAANTRSGDVSVLRTFSRNFRREPVYGTLFTLLPAGKNPSAIADKAFRLSH
ncbi:YncE family protein [Acidipila sp. EB88]|uniref:lactonase family protein n=1 Tax=Acidipila sp. EB88 TaxID=2305226 RepID=UPI000F5F1251|nr:YncE family protein [Acidipila sp. EB88]RRA49801.1 YncE family protein [Acidipila sp. EB88]